MLARRPNVTAATLLENWFLRMIQDSKWTRWEALQGCIPLDTLPVIGSKRKGTPPMMPTMPDYYENLQMSLIRSVPPDSYVCSQPPKTEQRCRFLKAKQRGLFCLNRMDRTVSVTTLC